MDNRAKNNKKRKTNTVQGNTGRLDFGLVCIVGLILLVYSLMFFHHNRTETPLEWTIVRQNPNGHAEIVLPEKIKNHINKTAGASIDLSGFRFCASYQLEDGTMVYVPKD